ncbi:MAG: CocE/NonD family hydrolase [Chloroflexi bacterium]|nr:CocE/NonD family hydrolase [Chloroflexota bacterium]
MTRPAPDARTASEPVYAVDTVWDARIRVRDGIELSANLWLPQPIPGGPTRFPAVLEMIPYGKDNWRRNADVSRGSYLAARGYALCRVDVRGTGSSGGIALDEYTAVETLDGYDAVEWLADQTWCTGAVGMWGISYGGFTSIQVATLRPPHLRAIVPVQATDDRYLTDVHYIGGCVTASELSQYAVSQVAMNAMPPDPAFHGEGWRETWLDRLAATPPWLIEWLRQQHDGPYWRQGSLAPEYDAIEAAILLVGGWMDSYVDAAFRMQAACTAPTRTIVGNWVHGLPSSATPGPNLDELHEIVRFFDHWLKGSANGADREPAVVWFEREYASPEPFPESLPGRWRATDAFPHPAVETRTWQFAGGALPLVGRLVGSDDAAGSQVAAVAEGVDRYAHRPTVGTRAGLSWGAGGPPNGLARDLRPDESLGPTYTSEPLTAAIEILGVPEVVLHLAVSAPVATAVVRLTDVAPDGTSAQVSAGILNLTHRHSHERPAPLEPGRVEAVRVLLRPAGYRFMPGHRIRVSVASSAWPVVWPSPYAADFELHRGPAAPSHLALPIVPAAGGPGDLPVPAFKTTPPDAPPAGAEGAADLPAWQITTDVIDDSVTVSIHDGGEDILDDGRRLYSAETLALTASDSDPASARLEADVVYRWAEHAFTTEIRARSTQTSDVDAFDLRVELEVDVDGEPFFRRSWQESIERRLV